MQLIIVQMLLLLDVISIVLPAKPACVKTSACSCKFPDGNGVDLSSLDTQDPQNPKFPDVPPDSGSDEYSWNPCTAFTEGDCSDVALCESHQNDKKVEYFPIGTQDSADFSYNNDGVLQITYVYMGTGGAQRQSFISLTCDPNQPQLFTVTGEKPPGSGMYYFDLTSELACYPTEDGKKTGSGISAGTVICIVLAIVIVLYLIGGVGFQCAIRKERGLQALPNKDFWTSLPGLIKDGTLFICRRGKSAESKRLLS